MALRFNQDRFEKPAVSRKEREKKTLQKAMEAAKKVKAAKAVKKTKPTKKAKSDVGISVTIPKRKTKSKK